MNEGIKGELLPQFKEMKQRIGTSLIEKGDWFLQKAKEKVPFSEVTTTLGIIAVTEVALGLGARLHGEQFEQIGKEMSRLKEFAASAMMHTKASEAYRSVATTCLIIMSQLATVAGIEYMKMPLVNAYYNKGMQRSDVVMPAFGNLLKSIGVALSEKQNTT